MTHARKILVTGATGFIGRALLSRLVSEVCFVPVAAARRRSFVPESIEFRAHDLGVLDEIPFLGDVDTVIHTAARVHMLAPQGAKDDAQAYQALNVAGTIELAKKASEAKTRRFIFISSIAVNGNSTKRGQRFSDLSTPHPHNAYGMSKAAAEKGIMNIAAESGMEVVIIRPPLVYGPGAPANVQKLLALLRLGIPLPFGAIKNSRSFVSIGNLVDLIMCCIDHPRAAGEIFLVSDGCDLSTTQFMIKLRDGVNRGTKIFPCPVGPLSLFLKALGKAELSRQLFSSLQVDIQKNQQLLGWIPRADVESSIRDTAEYFKKKQ
jgi:nucleoside-diphosphate-sugar epimerase